MGTTYPLLAYANAMSILTHHQGYYYVLNVLTIFATINEFFLGLAAFMRSFSAAGKYAEEVVTQTILDARQEAEQARKLKELPE